MSSDIAIDVNGLAKVYRIFRSPPDRLKQVLWRGRRKFYEEFWALHPISFQVKRGECVGFLGKNGSGKSTLLQMIAGTLDPSQGSFNASGRLSALLELGAGFDPEFTGRENVILSGALLGISAADMKERLPAILEFSELGDFIDKPVKTYSSGMYVRLAFSAAIHVEPEVLLVDEALSVGDAAFQYKCLKRIGELRKKGMSILFVTHDTGAVRTLCDRVLWLDSGNLISQGPAVEVADQYDSFMRHKAGVSDESRAVASPSPTASPSEAMIENDTRYAASLVSGSLRDHNNSSTELFLIGGELNLEIAYEVHQPNDGLVVGAAVFRNDDLYVCGLNTRLDHFSIANTPGRHSVTLRMPRLSLLGGDYYFKAGIFDPLARVRWDFSHRLASFRVAGPYLAEGVMVPEHSWIQGKEGRESIFEEAAN
jgi:teichoic acid transport system ATP-binding protein